VFSSAQPNLSGQDKFGCDLRNRPNTFPSPCAGSGKHLLEWTVHDVYQLFSSCNFETNGVLDGRYACWPSPFFTSLLTPLSEKTPNTGWMARRCTIFFLIQNRSKCSRHLHRKVLACRFCRYFRLHDSPVDIAKEYAYTLLLLHRLKADSHSKWHVTVMMVAFNSEVSRFQFELSL